MSSMQADVVREKIASWPKWYQAIEVVPGVWTRGESPRKTRPILEQIQRLVSERRVLDVGCNSGLYTLWSAMYGAEWATGVDKRVQAIEQAQYVRRMWLQRGRRVRETSFSCGSVLDALDSRVQDKDVVLACCVLYHLGAGVRDLMEAVSRAKVGCLVLQGNMGRVKKITDPARLEGNTLCTPIAMERLAEHYGYQTERVSEGSHPVVVATR